MYRNRKQAALVLLAGFGFTGTGIWFVLDGSAFDVALGVASIVVFGGGAVAYLVILLGGKPALVVDEHGITDNASLLSAGFLPWHEIVSFRLHTVGWNSFLIVEVTDPQAVLGRVNAVRRMQMRGTLRANGSPVSIPVRALAMPIDELRDELATRRPDQP